MFQFIIENNQASALTLFGKLLLIATKQTIICSGPKYNLDKYFESCGETLSLNIFVEYICFENKYFLVASAYYNTMYI